MTDNLAQLFLAAATLRSDARFGMASDPWTLVRSVETSGRAAAAFRQSGLQPGDRVALIGHTSMSYLLAWMALHMLGAEVALINPDYPAALLTTMLADLEPQAVVWSGVSPDCATAPAVAHLDASNLATGLLRVGGEVTEMAALSGIAPGAQRRSLDIAGYMHTSGTTGTPKFCAQTHSYFISLGRFIAELIVCLTRRHGARTAAHVPHQPTRIWGHRRADRAGRHAHGAALLREPILADGARHGLDGPDAPLSTGRDTQAGHNRRRRRGTSSAGRLLRGRGISQSFRCGAWSLVLRLYGGRRAHPHLGVAQRRVHLDSRGDGALRRAGAL